MLTYPHRTVAALVVMIILSLIAIGVCSADVTPPLSVVWAHSMGPDPGNLTTATVVGDRVFVARNGIAHCLDGLTGAEQWRFQPGKTAVVVAPVQVGEAPVVTTTNLVQVTTAPVLAGEFIAVGANDATLYALNRATGAVVWKVTASAPIAPSPLLMDDLLLFAAGEMVYAVRPETGAVAWICSLAETAAAGPVTDGSMVYFLGNDGSVQCVDATDGRYRWGVKLRTGPETFPPLVSSRRAIVATGKWVYAIARSGAISWTAEMPAGVGNTPTLIDDSLYVPCVDGRIYVLSGRSGAAERGVVYQSDYALTSSPALTDTTIFVGTAEGLLLAFDRATGAVKWTYRTRPPDQLPEEGAYWGVYGPLQLSEGTLLALTGAGDLYRLSAMAPDGAGPTFGDLQPKQGDAIAPAEYGGVSCTVIDDGSGVEANSIRAELDGRSIPVTFDPITGMLMLQYSALSDGLHVVRIFAKDARGNEAMTEWSFVTDATIVPTLETGAAGQAGRQGQQGGMGGRGGGGMGGRGGGMRGGMQ